MIPESRLLLAAGIFLATPLLALAQAPPATASHGSLMMLRQMQRPRNDTAALSADQRCMIADHMQACWVKGAHPTQVDSRGVLLVVTTDVAGVVRKVEVAGLDMLRVSGDPNLYAFAEQAIQALMDPRCVKLPLPPSALGRANILTFRFHP